MSYTIPPEDQAWWREVAERGLAAHQLQNMVLGGDEILDAFAALFAYLDATDARRLDGGYFFEGDGVGWALRDFVVDFVVAPAGDVRILAGSPILTTSWGLVFVLANDLAIPAASNIATAQCVARWAGYDGNADAQLVDRFFLDDTLVEPEQVLSWSPASAPADITLLTNAMVDGTAVVLNVGQQTDSGSDGPLDLLANSRGVFRVEGESDLALALRARALARRVTPDNIKAIVDEILVLVGSSCEVVTWYNAATGGAVSFTFDDETLGAFDVSPFGQSHRFMVLVRDFDYVLEGGWAFGDPDGGAFDVASFGAVFANHAAVLDAVRVAVDEARAFGYDGEVTLVNADWTTTPGLTV